MATPTNPTWRGNSFTRDSPSPSPGCYQGSARPKSAIMSSPLSEPRSAGHIRNQSLSSLSLALLGPDKRPGRPRTDSKSSSTSISNTFAPKFIKSEDPRRQTEHIRSIEGENDFSGKRYVWVKDVENAFVKGWVVKEMDEGQLLVQCDDGSQREADAANVDKVNPAKFDKVGDMAELTHLNEPSVVHNLYTRYQADLIYTYSGLFLVTVNPYCPLPIYGNEFINMYRGRSREDNKPHIYAMADEAFRSLVEEGENQSILVTGESGAGKTENTKKVIQYLAAVATSDAPTLRSGAKQLPNLSQQILRANPILESFGNAQTVRNNNSSRFGKFIRIEFSRAGHIAGAYIDWYLLEKSRVVRLNSNERNYHIFYQLLRGADTEMKKALLLHEMDVGDFAYTKNGNDIIAGVSDFDEWRSLNEAFAVMGFSPKEQFCILKTIAGVLHLGNIVVVKESMRADQARLDSAACRQAEKVCQLLGVPAEPFIQGLLHPRVKAGRELVEKVQTPEQVRLSIDALAKGMYERCFGDLVAQVNRQLDRTGAGHDDTHFIGVLDIAGFEIFEENSFEQLCINYTNEKLQQFFNHHMFVLEQEEYAREQIEWSFIDFGEDLQPTIDLIELPNPIGIFSCLDEDSVMPKATDKTFTEKLNSLWDKKTPKYRRSLLTQGFMLTHYAAEVEYTTNGWLEKNKDPMNENLTRLLATSKDKYIAHLFADCADPDDAQNMTKSRVKKGLFRTVAQRHKEQLSSLMSQLQSTHPHFVRCIIPNHKKRPKSFSTPLVLDQLRCNGVLEGIRIARTGFPNRLPFSEFRQRYEVLCRNMPTGYLDGQTAAQIILEQLDMDSSFYRVGLTKVFFRAGVLAELEEKRDALIREIMCEFQSIARGFTQRRIAQKRFYRAEASRIIQNNFRAYLDLCENPWWNLFVRMKPLLGATQISGEVKKRDDMIKKLATKLQQEATDIQRLNEERRRAESEVQRVQQTLESERALALDKEEIFKRLQYRETELSDKLTEAIHDQEQLEDQLDQLVVAKTRAEEDCQSRRERLEQAAQIIASLETGKEALETQIRALEQRLEAESRVRSESDNAHESLSQEIKLLKSHLSLKDRKAQDLETKLLKSDQELDDKLASTTKDLQLSKKQVKDLIDENRRIRLQLSELALGSTRNNGEMARKDEELATLRSEIKKYETDRSNFEEQRRSLSAKQEGLQRRLEEETKRLQKQLNDAQLSVTSLEKQREKLSLNVEDLNHQLTQERKSSRTADKATATLQTQLAETHRNLETERQQRSKAQAHAQDVQGSLDQANMELKQNHDHLTLLQKFFNADGDSSQGREIRPRDLSGIIDLAKKLEDSQQALRMSTEKCVQAEARLSDFRKRYQEELSEIDDKHFSAKRNLLEELDQNKLSITRSPKNFRPGNDMSRWSNTSTPSRRKISGATEATHDSGRSDAIPDTSTYRKKMDLAVELSERLMQTMDELQASEPGNQLQTRRLERELREEKEKTSRLERELEGWKALRMERGNLGRSGTSIVHSEMADVDEGRRPPRALPEVPPRKVSNTKGFL